MDARTFEATKYIICVRHIGIFGMEIGSDSNALISVTICSFGPSNLCSYLLDLNFYNLTYIKYILPFYMRPD